MIGSITQKGYITYTVFYDDKTHTLYFYEQSMLAAKVEDKNGISSVVYESNRYYYTIGSSNVIFCETLLGHVINNYIIEDVSSVKLVKILNDTHFILELENEVVIYDLMNKAVIQKLPFNKVSDYSKDSDHFFSITGHKEVSVSSYEEDDDKLDILYAEYSTSRELLEENKHFGIVTVDDGEKKACDVEIKGMTVSLFDNYLESFIYPTVLTRTLIVSLCPDCHGFIIHNKYTGGVEFIISIPKEQFDHLGFFGFNEDTDVLTVVADKTLHHYKVLLGKKTDVQKLNIAYMEKYIQDKNKSLRGDFEIDYLYHKAINACKIFDMPGHRVKGGGVV